MEQPPQTSTNKPAAEVKSGAIVGTIWMNEGPNGPFPTITVTRFYKGREDNWKRTKTLRPKDMPDVVAVATQMTEKLAELVPAQDEPATETQPETPKTKAAGRKAKNAA